MKAHELAKKLLEGPDLEVRFQDEDSPYAGYVEGVDSYPGEFCPADDFPDEDEDWDDNSCDAEEAAPWQKCITLNVDSNDGVLKGESIVEN